MFCPPCLHPVHPPPIVQIITVPRPCPPPLFRGLEIFCPQRAESAQSLSGKWDGLYTGTFNGTFKLSWRQTGSKLIGRIRLSTGNYGALPVTGNLRGSHISFGTVGGKLAVTYTGSASGASMIGHWHMRSGGGAWSATKEG